MMLQERDRRKTIISAVIVIVLLQCLMLLYWQNLRSNFFVDELYCFGYASSFIAPESSYITDKPEWQCGEWMETDGLKGFLKVDSSESLQNLPLKEQLSLLTGKRTYMGLLNILMYDDGQDADFYQYAWSALFLNMWFFLISELLMAYCIKETTGSYGLMLLGIMMFGFSGIIAGMCEYVRFYMMTIMLMLIVVCCHLAIWKDKSVLRCLAFEMIAFVCAYYALMHSELMLVTCGTFFCFFFAGMLCRKRWKQAAVYAAPLLYGVYHYVWERTNLLDIVMHPADFAGPGHGVEAVTSNLLIWTPERGWDFAKQIYAVFATTWFGSSYLLVAFLVLLLTCCLCKGNRDDERSKDSPARYGGFILILVLTAFMSFLFNILTGLSVARHSSFTIVLLMIVTWYLAGVAWQWLDKNRFMLIITVLTMISAVLCQNQENFPYLYINEKNIRAQIADCGCVDNLLFNYGDRHSAYDCIANSRDGTRIYAVAPETAPSINNIKEAPDLFLAWCMRDVSVDTIKIALEGTDYQAKPLGSTWLNNVYLCSKK